MRAVNQNAQEEVGRVLDYLEQIRGKKLILGQHTQTMAQEELAKIRAVTGELPALCGFELLGYSPNINFSESDEECLKEVREAQGTLQKAWEWAEKGGLITLTWHWFSPLGGKGKTFYAENTPFLADRAVIEGTEEHAALLSDMDYMAGLLKPFCDAHIPILWRPFHENDGNWFWWGTCERETVQKLYRIMYDRYVNHFHLDNLIWVFNSVAKECYPGDDVIDIITRDMYPPAHQHGDFAQELSQLQKISETEKLYALAEIGTIPDVRAVTEHHVPWCWFMTWSKEFVLTENYTNYEELRRAYADENAVTLSRLPELYRMRIS